MDSASICRAGCRLDSRLLYAVRFLNLEIQVQMLAFHDVDTLLIYLDSALLNRWNIATLHIHRYVAFLSCLNVFCLPGMWDHQFLTLDCQARMSKQQSGCCQGHAPKSTAEGLIFILGHSQVSNWNLWRSACTPYFGLTHCCTLITCSMN